MKIYIKFFIFFFIISNAQQDSTWIYKKNKIVIPFELSNNIPFIKVNLNGIELNMIFDTGADSNLIFTIPENEELEINNANITQIYGLGLNEPIKAIQSKNNTLTIGKYKNINFEVLIINDSLVNLSNKFGIEINGIIGYNFFKDKIIEINYEKEKIILHPKNYEFTKKIIQKYTSKKLIHINSKPHFEIYVPKNNVKKKYKMLLDTGLSDAFWFFKNDTVPINPKNIHDFLGTGISGNIEGKRARIEKITFDSFEFNNMIVAYPDSISVKNLIHLRFRNGFMGGGIIKKFNWIFDYNNNMVYFKKNKYFDLPLEYNMSGIEVENIGKEWIANENFSTPFIKTDNDIAQNKFSFRYILKPIFKISFVRNPSNAFDAGFKKGDKIISINNKRAQNLTLEKIYQYFQTHEGAKLKITVERNGVLIKKNITLEKII